MTEGKEFDKKLAKLQIAATAGTALGTVLMALGITLIAISTTLGFEAVDENEDRVQFFKIFSQKFLYQGVITFFVGIAVFLGCLVGINHTIKKLK